MKLLKKLVSALLTGVIAISAAAGMSVGASAASSKMELLKTDMSKITNNKFLNLGSGLYLINDHDFVRIGEKEIANWQKSGNLKPTRINTDYKFPKNWKIFGSAPNDPEYFFVAGLDDNGYRTSTTILKYNAGKNSINKVKTYNDANYHFVNSKGYAINEPDVDFKNNIISVKVDTPDGKSFTNKFKATTFKNSNQDFLAYNIINPANNKYIYYIMIGTDSSLNPLYADKANKYYDHSMIVYGIDKNGKATKLDEFSAAYFGFISAGVMLDTCNEYIMYQYAVASKETVYRMCFNNNSKKIELYDSTYIDYNKLAYDGRQNVNAKLEDFTSIHKNNRVVAHFAPMSEAVTDGAYGIYKLFDTSGDTLKTIGKPYKDISTLDNKTYLICSFKDKWGFMNSNGKVLAWFDDAGYFDGTYAPVVKDGKAYLVNKNMKQASKSISANGVSTYSKGLYRVTNGNKRYLVTYKK